MNPLPVLTFVSGNAGKIHEVKTMIGGSVQLETVDMDLPELQGEPEDIVRSKCELAAKSVGGFVLVEDTCLCYNALNGLPGPYVKWFLEKTSLDGLHKLLDAYEDKSAYALCTFALTMGTGHPIHVFSGRCEGTIVSARGSTKFGWDSVFQPAGYTKTFAEMTSYEKNAISHRSRALTKVVEFLNLYSMEMTK